MGWAGAAGGSWLPWGCTPVAAAARRWPWPPLPSLNRSPGSFPRALSGLGGPGTARSHLWGLAEHPVMRKTSIPGWAPGSARPGEAAGNYHAERCRLCQRRPGRAKPAVTGWMGLEGRQDQLLKPPSSCPLVIRRQPGAGTEWACARSWLRPEGGQPVPGFAVSPWSWVALKVGSDTMSW